jgi:8-oxo-dGTP pyrophosphatase MutT (NUDIX family)/predicted RNA-binding Zn-ribbon protein involved in translation (DUF1610 family)
MKIKGKIHQTDQTQNFCPDCWSESIAAYQADGREHYRCKQCGYDASRLIQIYPQMRYQVLPDDELLHYSVGAVIEWENRVLLFHRRLFPFQYTIVAGHWDLDDATPELAVAREIQEEAGIDVQPENPVFMERVKEPCRRGADFHEWRLYRVQVDDNRVVMSDEADIIGWYAPAEIRKLELTIPTAHFLRKLGII